MIQCYEATFSLNVNFVKNSLFEAYLITAQSLLAINLNMDKLSNMVTANKLSGLQQDLLTDNAKGIRYANYMPQMICLFSMNLNMST